MNDLVFVFSAFVLGGLHALEPGHGKTVVAAYLVGSKGRMRDAITLGGVVTFTHTFSIIVLGILTSIAAAYFVPDTVHEVMEVVSGLLILGVGVWMLRRRFGHGSEPDEEARAHEHRHGDREHEHPHGHEHAHESVVLTHEDSILARSLPASLAATVVLWQRDHDAHHHSDPTPAMHSAGSGFVSSSVVQHAHGDDWHAHAVATAPRHHHHGLNEDAPGHDHPDDAAGHLHDEHALHTHEGEHGHQHSDYEHHHEHSTGGHSHGGREHSHAPVPGDRLGLRGLIALGVSGGMVPCPAALALLLSATTAGSVLAGVGLVLVFSLGLAVVLIAIGITMVKAANLASRRLSANLTDRISRHAAAFSAVVVTLLGAGATARAVLHVTGLIVY